MSNMVKKLSKESIIEIQDREASWAEIMAQKKFFAGSHFKYRLSQLKKFIPDALSEHVFHNNHLRPMLRFAIHRFKDKKVVVLGVNYQENLRTVKKFIKEMNMSYPVALDISGAIFAKFARTGVARNVVLDQNFKIIYLTRLFDIEEFNGMVELIKTEIK